MSEFCPLSGIGHATRDLPRFCYENCEGLWDKAVREQNPVGEYDIYPQLFDDGSNCDHIDTDLEHSHAGLQSTDNSDRRFYTLVDQCMGCGTEYGEQSFLFHCPRNETI